MKHDNLQGLKKQKSILSSLLRIKLMESPNFSKAQLPPTPQEGVTGQTQNWIRLLPGLP